MRIIASKKHISSLTALAGMEPEAPVAEPTPAQVEAEAEAAFTTMRKASKEQYPNMSNSNGQVFKEDPTDHQYVIKRATKVLQEKLKKMGVYGGGDHIRFDDFAGQAAHNDIADDSLITDKALIGFEVDFALPGTMNRRTAKFVVEQDDTADEKYVVAEKFYDNDENEYKLTQDNLEKFLSEGEAIVAKKNLEQPLAYFDVENDALVAIPAPAGTAKVAKRLVDAGYAVREEYVDATHGPKTFGRICFVVDVPVGKNAEFLKIASMTDEQWFSRGTDNGKDSGPDMGKSENWFERGKEQTGYTKRTEVEDAKTWPERGREKGPENPYGSEKAQLASDAMKKEDKNLKEAQKNAEAALKELQDLVK